MHKCHFIFPWGLRATWPNRAWHGLASNQKFSMKDCTILYQNLCECCYCRKKVVLSIMWIRFFLDNSSLYYFPFLKKHFSLTTTDFLDLFIKVFCKVFVIKMKWKLCLPCCVCRQVMDGRWHVHALLIPGGEINKDHPFTWKKVN